MSKNTSNYILLGNFSFFLRVDWQILESKLKILKLCFNAQKALLYTAPPPKLARTPKKGAFSPKGALNWPAAPPLKKSWIRPCGYPTTLTILDSKKLLSGYGSALKSTAQPPLFFQYCQQQQLSTRLLGRCCFTSNTTLNHFCIPPTFKL